MRYQTFLNLFFLVCVFCSATHGVHCQNTDPELDRLRRQWAMRYLEPGPHMELAKYFKEKGNFIQAFYILENARRRRFEEKVFDAAFLLHFGGFRPLDNSKAEEEKYLGLRKTAPNDIGVIIHLADIYVSRGDFVNAEPLFKVALEKDPENFVSVGALAEIYRRQGTMEKAKQILSTFERQYPTAASSYEMRITREIDSDPIATKKLIDEALKKYPDDGRFWFYLAVLADRKKKIKEAEEYFVKAAELGKNGPEIQARTAGFFRVEKSDNATALKYYLNTYFLDPHAHFDGFAEAKVSGLNYDLSKSLVEKSLASGIKAEDLLQDPNPMVVVLALQKLSEKWDSKNTELFVQMMRHDETMVRWFAMQSIITNEGAAFDKRLKDLLKDSDIRVRGLSAYIAVHLWKERSFPEMKRFLLDDAELLRFDAVSALLINGGAEGRKIVLEHEKKEPNASLRELIETASKK